MELSSGGQISCSTGFPRQMSVLGTCLYQCTTGVVVRGCIQLQWIFWNTVSIHLSISWWVIYERTCPHHTECSAVFDQKQHDPHAHPSYSPNFAPRDFFCLFPLMKKPSKGNVLQMLKKRNKKMTKALKGIKINEFKNCFEEWGKRLARCIASNGEYFEGDWSLNM